MRGIKQRAEDSGVVEVVWAFKQGRADQDDVYYQYVVSGVESQLLAPPFNLPDSLPPTPTGTIVPALKTIYGACLYNLKIIPLPNHCGTEEILPDIPIAHLCLYLPCPQVPVSHLSNSLSVYPITSSEYFEYMYVCVRAHMHVHVHVCVRTRMYMCMHSYIH